MNVIGISGLSNTVAFKKKEFPGLSPRQYRIAQGFDAAAALVTSAGVKAAVAEERFNKEKKTPAFPASAIRYCLQADNLKPEMIDYVAHGFSYEPVRSFFEQDPYTQKQFRTVYSREALLVCLQQHFPDWGWDTKLVQIPHHLAHAASAFYLSDFNEALILIADGMGEIHSTTIAIGRDNQIDIIKQVPALHSLGILYGVMTLYLGFFMNFDEYKVMGLAPYGNPQRYFHQLMQFVHLEPDGTYTVPLLFHNRTIEEKETYNGSLQTLADLFGPPREPGAEITQKHKDIAAALQATLQATLMHVLQHFKRKTGQQNLCMAGGVALNCTANGVIKRSRLFKRLFVQPAAADDGTALGAALAVHRQHEPDVDFGPMLLPLWGPEFDDEAIRHVLGTRGDCHSVHFDSFFELAQETAARIARGQIVAWFQGRMEFGPRALGNRSILADPRDPGMRTRVNRLIKKREGFRPFAPSVTAESATRFFEVEAGDDALYAHMLFVTQVRPPYDRQLPAITHVDGSARIQTVTKNGNPRYWTLLNEFGRITGVPVLLNTSFNVRGQPIVCTPTDALDTFLAAGLDTLVMGHYLVEPVAV